MCKGTRLSSQLYNEYQRVYVAPLHCPYYIFTQFPYKNYRYYCLKVYHHIPPISYLSLLNRRLNRLYNRILLYIMFTNSLVGLCHLIRVLRCSAFIVTCYDCIYVWQFLLIIKQLSSLSRLSRYVHRRWIYYMLFYLVISLCYILEEQPQPFSITYCVFIYAPFFHYFY